MNPPADAIRAGSLLVRRARQVAGSVVMITTVCNRSSQSGIATKHR
jgi:hypothetical protein